MVIHVFYYIDLQEVIEGAYENPPIKSYVINHMYDFKEWLTPHLAGHFSHHTGPHNFKFVRKSDGTTIMQYRQYTGQVWEPDEGLQCLQVI